LYSARLSHGPVALAFTDRHGGVSRAPYDSLNLAWAGDDAGALAENHQLLSEDFAPGVIGGCHAGRPGVVLGVVPATVARMRELGARDITAWLGPYVCGRCYEVPQEMQDEVAAAVPATRATTSWGTPAVDIGAGIRSQLADEGVACVDLSVCTRESPDLYSYRRDRLTSGRQAGVIRMASA
jgi:copper oxidase (laccase) domain-containing protein